MSLLSAMSIALSGLGAATRRLEVSASNIANVETTGAVPGADGKTNAYRALTVQQSDVAGGGVEARAVALSPGYRIEIRPGDPNADEKGRVAAPDVDITGEMGGLLMARASYAAAAKVMKVADEMQRETTDIFT